MTETSNNTALLRAERVEKRYGATRALKDVSFSVHAGEVHALMGENGAGKSTLGKIIAGVVQADTGRFVLDGQGVQIDSPRTAQQLGIGIVFQELDIFPNLSVAENIVVGNREMERRSFVNWTELISFCSPFLHDVGLRVNPRTRAGDLRIGEMQLLAIARTLSFKARLIVMDEPTSSLSQDAVAMLFSVIRHLKAQGVSIIYVSHKMNEILEIADRITVLRDGEKVATRLTGETSIEEIISMMVGRTLADKPERVPVDIGSIILRAEGISSPHIQDVSFDLRLGEVLGVAGLVGSGASELGAALFGIDQMLFGTITLKSRPFCPTSPAVAMRAGLGLVPEDRKLEGLMLHMSARENTTIGSLRRFQRFGLIHRKFEKQSVIPIHKRLRLSTGSDPIAENLSGGNQQKVLLARWLLADPDVLFLNDPTRGIDIGAKQEIYQLIAELTQEGKSIILVSSELGELLANCDRILVMSDRRCRGILNAHTATQEDIMALAAMGDDSQSK